MSTVYSCPMYLEVRQAKPGQCPKCGMDLVPEKEEQHDQSAEHPRDGAADGDRWRSS